MNAIKAYIILKKKFPKVSFYSCTEYDSSYVFSTDKPGSDTSFTNGLWAVDKATSKVQNFKPFKMSVEEYQHGKKVPINKWKVI